MQFSPLLRTISESSTVPTHQRANGCGSDGACGCAGAKVVASWRSLVGLSPVVALVILPKCPVCLAAWFGVLGMAVSIPWLHSVWQPWAWPVLGGCMVAVLAWRWMRHGNWRAFAAGSSGVGLLLVGKQWDSVLLLGAGVVLVTVALLWGNGRRDNGGNGLRWLRAKYAPAGIAVRGR